MREEWVKIEYKKLVDKISTTKKKIKQREYNISGKVPIVDQGQELIGGFTNDETKILDCNLPVIIFGDHTKIIKIVNFSFAPGADGTKVLQPKTFILPQLLAHFTQIIVHKIKDKGYARHYQHVEKQHLGIPPLPEQRAIVAKIEELFGSLDSGVAELKAAKEKLEIYRQAVLKKAFEGELTENNDMEWIKLGEVCENVQYGTSSKSLKKGKIPVLRMGNIQKGNIDWNNLAYTNNDEEIEKYRLYNNDVLFNRTNSPEWVGKTAIYRGEKPAIFAGYLIRVNYKKNLVVGDYLNYFLNSHIAKVHGNKVKSFGVNQSNINGTKLKKYPFPLTTIDLQLQIVQEIETRLSVCDKIMETIDESLEQAEALRQSILKKAFEGELLSESELETCRKEPDWEPAEKLLERIKKEKKKS